MMKRKKRRREGCGEINKGRREGWKKGREERGNECKRVPERDMETRRGGKDRKINEKGDKKIK